MFGKFTPVSEFIMGKQKPNASKLSVSVRQSGILKKAANIFRRVRNRYFPPKPDFTTSKRTELGMIISRMTGGVVVHGPFSGTRLPGDLMWGRADLGAMLLGFYEKDVVAALESKTATRNLLVNVGAGDGFYVNGALVSGMVKSAIAFESDLKSRRVMRQGLRINNIENKAEILGQADETFSAFLNARTDFTLLDIVILMDIEGGEYSILNEQTLRQLLGACLIIELHEFTDEQVALAAELIQIAEKAGHTVSWIHSEGRNPYSIPELEFFSDNDKWALCSEGRPSTMRWLVLESAM